MDNFSESNQNPRIFRYNDFENSTKKIRALIGLKSCFNHYENKEQARVVDVMMAQEKRTYILIMCVSKRN